MAGATDTLSDGVKSLVSRNNNQNGKKRKKQIEHEGAVGQVHLRVGALPAVPLLGEIVVGTTGHPVHLRRVYHQEDQVAVVEGVRRTSEVGDVVG